MNDACQVTKELPNKEYPVDTEKVVVNVTPEAHYLMNVTMEYAVVKLVNKNWIKKSINKQR